MKRRDLHGAVVVVTGATSGLGRATAHAFAERGAHLVLAARDTSTLSEVAAECHRLGARAIGVPTDVTDADDVLRLADVAGGLNGRIDVWVNNAGVGAVGAFDQTPLAAHEQVIQTDLLGYVRGAYAAVPFFKRRGRGVLINILSVGSWVPQPYAVAYSAAKYGLRGYSEALRGELSAWRDIHVCDVYPTLLDTPGLRDGANYSGHAVKPPAPVVDPRRAARTVASLAERPRDSVTVGRITPLIRLGHALTPGYSRLAARLTEQGLRLARPAGPTAGNLFRPPARERRVEGGWRSPGGRLAVALVGAAAVAALGCYASTRYGGIRSARALPGRHERRTPAFASRGHSGLSEPYRG